jgi:hypothetical protein
MLQAGGEADLSLESLGPQGDCQVRTQYLQSYEAVVSQVMRQIDRSHPTTSELPLYVVGSPHTGLKPLQRISHRGASTTDYKAYGTGSGSTSGTWSVLRQGEVAGAARLLADRLPTITSSAREAV